MDLQQINTICPICLDTFKNPYSIGCSHLFCKICIVKWLDEKDSCPVCRKNYVGMYPVPINLITSRYKTRKITEYWRTFKIYVQLQKMLDDYVSRSGNINNDIYRMNEILKYVYENKWIFKTDKIKLWGYDFRRVLKEKIDEFSNNKKYPEAKIWKYKFRDILK